MKVKTMNNNHRSRSLAVGVVLLAALSSQAGSNYTMKKSVIVSGNEVNSSSYVMNSGIGQPVTTQSSSSSYQLTAGFFQENRDLIFFNEFEINQ